MNPLLQPSVQEYLLQNENEDESILLLKKQTIHGVKASLIAQQIIGRKKAKLKIPIYYDTKTILYPPPLHIEQCSSQATATFKASQFSGEKIADLSGGFGVDSALFSSSFQQVSYIEPDQQLFDLAKHNHEALTLFNIKHYNDTAEGFLEKSEALFDLIYIDPSRRDAANKKVFKFSACNPNIVSLIPHLLKITKRVLIKASPLHDIQQGINELQHATEVMVLSVDNECKELLFVLESDSVFDCQIRAVDLDRGGTVKSSFIFQKGEELKAEVNFATPKSYLYEPSASVLKAGPFKLISSRFKIDKLAPNTHLYTSDNLISDFPGKSFQVHAQVKANAKSIGALLGDNKPNITTRNYPLTPEELKKKLKLKDGGDKFIIGCAGQQQKFLLLATKV